MDYQEMAEELLQVRAELTSVPADRQITETTRGEWFVLHSLAAHGRAVYPRELSREMNVSTARVAALLRHMEEKQWIHRAEDPEDCRQIQVTLTPAGREALEKRRASALAAAVRLLEALGPEDAGEFLRLEHKLAASTRAEQDTPV